MDIRFRLLGPLHVAGVPRIEPRGQRVLSVLLLAVERKVSRDALIDAIWDDNPPLTAARQLLNCVCSLRRKLGAGCIVSDAKSYQVRATSRDVDAHVFTALTKEAEQLRAAGRFTLAVQRLRLGLGLWRGPVLAGLTGKFLEPAASRLDEQRLAALESCLELEVALGRTGVAAELAGLVRANPLRERIAALFMLALQQAQRRAEALKVYRNIRTRLSEELGLEPGSELQAVHLAVLRGDRLPPSGPVIRAFPRQHLGGRCDEPGHYTV